MAASNTAVKAATVTLTAATESRVLLTGSGSQVLITAHAPDAIVYAKVTSSEQTAIVAAADELSVVTGNVPRVLGAITNGGTWIALISAGTPTVTCELIL